MSNVGKEIGNLLEVSNVAAPDVTKPLKTIGNGNMLNGVKTIYNFAMAEGEKKGLVKGGVFTLGALGVVYVGTKGVGFIKKKLAAKKAHEETGRKILESFEEELTEEPSKEAVDAYEKNKSEEE